MRVLMVAAENGGLPGGKVGGMGDVIRDVPGALATQGCEVDVLTPGYQYFSRLPGAVKTTEFDVPFESGREKMALHRLPGPQEDKVTYLALENRRFSADRPGQIYCDDPPERPFASDAVKFALFCRGVCEALISGAIETPDVLHLHDWHSALTVVLLKYDPAYRRLAGLRTVYTVHNLSLQGIRPFAGDESAVQSWFPNLEYAPTAINDPLHPHCFNPMRAAINLCDRVHAVSPNYVREIQAPSEPERGYVGGEGLERDLRMAAKQGRLFGILNGCDYSQPAVETDYPAFLSLARAEVVRWLGAERYVRSAHLVALQTLERWRDLERPNWVVTSVGRLTDQKVRLLREPLPDGRKLIEAVLDDLGSDGALVMMGSGDMALEDFFTMVAAQRSNMLFLQGYSDPLSQQVYAGGDLFLMPSSFEPCGISQMLAMRAGQPCLAHAVGGLVDTIEDGRNGFLFSGESPRDQITAMMARLKDILDTRRRRPAQWKKVRQRAAATRFSWKDVACDYLKYLYC